jgi:hypothetical protein
VSTVIQPSGLKSSPASGGLIAYSKKKLMNYDSFFLIEKAQRHLIEKIKSLAE